MKEMNDLNHEINSFPKLIVNYKDLPKKTNYGNWHLSQPDI